MRLIDYIGKDDLLNGIYSENPKDVMKYIAGFPTADVVSKELYDQVKFERNGLQEIVDNSEQWIPVEEQNPEIDMSYPHSECYLVTYEGGTLDVARWSNVNPFWTDHVTEPRWWGQQFCKVIAWMPLPEPWKGAEDAEVH